MSIIEKLLIYGGVLYLFIFIILPITIFYWINKLKNPVITFLKNKPKMNDCARLNYYLKIREKFNKGMKEGILKRDKIIRFKNLIDTLLAENLKHYRTFEFNNDCHEVYTKLKNSNFTELDYIQMYDYLNKLVKDK